MEIIGELNTKGNISRDKVKQGNQILNTMLNYTLIFFFFKGEFNLSEAQLTWFQSASFRLMDTSTTTKYLKEIPGKPAVTRVLFCFFFNERYTHNFSPCPFHH